MKAVKETITGNILFQFNFPKRKPVLVYLNNKQKQVSPGKQHMLNGEIRLKFWHELNNQFEEDKKLEKKEIPLSLRSIAFSFCRQILKKRETYNRFRKRRHGRRRKNNQEKITI
jgi:hypothetical protein